MANLYRLTYNGGKEDRFVIAENRKDLLNQFKEHKDWVEDIKGYRVAIKDVEVEDVEE